MDDKNVKTNGETEEKNIINILLDGDNKEPITLIDGNGNRITFEQIAVVPHGKDLYCVLKPVDKLNGLGEDGAMVFRVDWDEEEPMLVIETDELKAMDVFDEYYDLLEEEWGKPKGENDDE